MSAMDVDAEASTSAPVETSAAAAPAEGAADESAAVKKPVKKGPVKKGGKDAKGNGKKFEVKKVSRCGRRRRSRSLRCVLDSSTIAECRSSLSLPLDLAVVGRLDLGVGYPRRQLRDLQEPDHGALCVRASSPFHLCRMLSPPSVDAAAAAVADDCSVPMVCRRHRVPGQSGLG